jgi:hypothetical protein
MLFTDMLHRVFERLAHDTLVHPRSRCEHDPGHRATVFGCLGNPRLVTPQPTTAQLHRGMPNHSSAMGTGSNRQPRSCSPKTRRQGARC